MTHRCPDLYDSPPPQAHIVLPNLTADEALRFVALLERISAGIWQAYGQQMGELLLNDPTRNQTCSDIPTEPLQDLDDDMPF
jgi:hypothetical protein